MLKLNAEKAEVLVVGTLSKHKSLDLDSLTVAGSHVIIIDKPVRNLGVMMDRHMAMSAQVRQVVRTAYKHLRNIGLARGMLTVASTKQLVQALSRVNSCNSLLMCLPDSLIHLLDMVQRRAARLIHRDSGDQSVTGLMKDLLWLPVESRIVFKVLVLVYKCQNGLGSGYLTDMVTMYMPVRSLRSATQSMLMVPRTKLKMVSDRAFSVAGPSVWNCLPSDIKDSGSLYLFKIN